MKELPYFRFTVQEWQNGDISLESYELKGLFIDICAYYWLKDCSITIAMLEKRFSNATNLIKQLINLSIIKVKKDSEYLEINYLNEQFDILSKKRKLKQDAGSKGGKQKASNARSLLKQNPSYKDKDKDKDKVMVFDEFWNLYNKKVGDKDKCKSKFEKLSIEDKNKIFETLPTFLSKIKDKQYQPHPYTYLNNKRWNDELEIKQIQQQPKIKVRFGRNDDINKIYHLFFNETEVRKFNTPEERLQFMSENNMEL